MCGRGMKTILVFETTFGDLNTAMDTVKSLVEENLVACAHISSPEISLYKWEGELKDEPELRVTLKTSLGRKDKLIERLKELHSYELPQIIWREVNATEEYDQWVEGEIK